MSVMANPIMARHISYDDWLKLDPVVKKTQLAKPIGGGWVVGSTAGWLGAVVDEYYLEAAWDAIPPAEQLKKMQSGIVVMVTAN